MNLDLRLVLAAVIHDLADERLHAVDGQNRTLLKLTLLYDVGRPLLRQTRKLDVVKRCLTVLFFVVVAALERLPAVRQKVVHLAFVFCHYAIHDCDE
ncbi:hypothetical protein D3C87_1277980 [compost metagenome]